MRKLYWLTYSVATLSLTVGICNSISPVLAQEVPKGECLEAYGKVGCGYNCVEAYGNIKCADWPGGVCKEAYGQITCGPPAPADWLSRYTNNSNSNNRNSGIYGAWAVENGKWNGILRMQGNAGRMVLVAKTGASVEQKMTLKVNHEGGYILNGEVLTSYIREKYNADNFYIKQFSKESISVNNCDDTRQCNSVTLVYLGK